jgi:O-antigen ligase
MATFDHLWVWGLFDVAIAGFVLAKPTRLRATRPLLWLMAWLLLYFVVGYFLGDASDDATNTAQKALLILLPLFPVVGVALRNRRQWDRLAVALQVVAIGACAVSVAQALSPAVLDYTTLSDAAYAMSGDGFSLNRIPALWMNPNEAALCFFFTYAISLWCRIRWLAWAGRLASIVGTILTVSRGGWLNMAAFTAAYLLATPLMSLLQGRLKASVVARRFGSLVGIATAIGSLALVMPMQRDQLYASVSERVLADGRLTDDNWQRSEDLRYSLATYWFDKAASGPWYGRGLISFQVGDGAIKYGSHNQFIMVYGEVGIVGFLAYLFVLGIGLRRTWAIPMFQRDRLILLLIWGGFFFWHFKAHWLFSQRQYIVIWGVLFMAPYALRSARRPGTGITPFRRETRCAIR